MWKQMDIRKIGQFIKSEREKLGITQDELSKKIHADPVYIYTYS